MTKQKKEVVLRTMVQEVVKIPIVRIQILILIIIGIMISSCTREKKYKSEETLKKIVTEFKTSKYYSFEPYFRANLSTIVIDSTAAITIRCINNEIKEQQLFGKFNVDEIRIAKKTFNFCKKHNIYAINYYTQFSEIETNIYDSTFTEIKLLNPNYTDTDIAFYHVKDLEKAPYKFSVILLNKGVKIEEINSLKDKKLIPFERGVYLCRSFKNWDIDKFELLECRWW